MCRSIQTLYNVDPPVTEEQIQAASMQYVRKISGINTPSKANEAAFKTAVNEIAVVSARLLATLVTNSPYRERRLTTDVHLEQ
ncbi:MAG: hypothetical protein A2Y88_05265 [Chloroflexi bacterium RBG_13_48_10]|nr:MAG: hypothetical protein A2Y88_05265 [Chloroflexi bacterium RBG_13_48_10]